MEDTYLVPYHPILPPPFLSSYNVIDGPIKGALLAT